MLLLILVGALLAIGGLGCQGKPADVQPAWQAVLPWPKDWSACVGKSVTLEGIAVDSKLGALLLSEQDEIAIAGLDSWPTGFYRGGRDGKRLRVTGTVIVRDDVPAFVRRPGEPERTGVPVESEKDLEAARRRFILKDARWTVLE